MNKYLFYCRISPTYTYYVRDRCLDMHPWSFFSQKHIQTCRFEHDSLGTTQRKKFLSSMSAQLNLSVLFINFLTTFYINDHDLQRILWLILYFNLKVIITQTSIESPKWLNSCKSFFSYRLQLLSL